MPETLPEVTRLRDARGERPANAVGVGALWYEPEAWTLPLSPAARVLYAGLCSFLGHGEINRHDLRNTLKDRSDAEISEALVELANHNLLEYVGEVSGGGPSPGYKVRSVKRFGGQG